VSAKRTKRSPDENARRAAKTKARRERKDSKRRAYFADRIMRGKLTSRGKRKVSRLPLADLHRQKLAEETAKKVEILNAALEAEAAELDRIASIRAAESALDGGNQDAA